MPDIEGFNSFPEDYVIGSTKYLIVTGSVISGIGKGIITSSLSRLLESSNLDVMPFKFDGYLNSNAGTLNPYRHGEVFVLDDGMECDMDLGTYERFVNSNLSRSNYLTAGQLFEKILEKEKRGEYLGRDVQFIPHVTGEIKKILRERGRGCDVMIVEVGGTVGDIENSYFLEAVRELVNEEGGENVRVINVTYVLEPNSLDEQKSKAAQNGLKKLMKVGLKPDVVMVRSENPITDSIREKLNVASSIPLEHIFSVPDLDTIYELPLLLEDVGVHEVLGELFDFKLNPDLREWRGFVENLKHPKKEVKVLIAGKYTRVSDSYASIIEALNHAGAVNQTRVSYELVETTNVSYEEAREELKKFDGLIVPGGFGSRGINGKINFIHASRESNTPFLGLCFGMQLAVVEYARNVLGFEDAHTTEVDEDTEHPVIYLLPEQKRVEEMSGSMRLGVHETKLEDDSLVHDLYGKKIIRERFRHRFEVNPEYVSELEEAGLSFTGESEAGLVKQVMELEEHPFFIGSQFHPELTSKPLDPSPLFTGFVRNCLEKRE